MEYMEQKMDEQIEGALHAQQMEYDRIHHEMTEYIKQCGYTWSADDIMTEYRTKYKKGIYVSFTCKEVIKKFESALANVL